MELREEGTRQSHLSAEVNAQKAAPPVVVQVDQFDVHTHIAQLWGEILFVDDIQPDDDFFELGGDSVSAVQILSRINTEFKVKFEEAELFQVRTVRGLCELLEQRVTHLAVEDESEQTKPRTDFPLTSAQKRLWFLDRMIDSPQVYNVGRMIHLTGKLQPELLAAAFLDVVKRHAIFRTRIDSTGNEPVQIVEAELTTLVEVVDLTELPYMERKPTVLKQCLKCDQMPFNLAVAPLWRAKIYVTHSTECYFWINLHHMITDGWALGRLIAEVEQCYLARLKGDSLELPPPEMQFGDYAMLEAGWANSAKWHDSIDFWKQTLTPFPASLDFPFAHSRPKQQTFRGKLISFDFPRKLLGHVDRICRTHGVTRFMVGLAAFQALVHRYTGQNDVTIGSPVLNRSSQQLEAVQGMFVNTLVLRSQISSDINFLQLLQHVGDVRSGALNHQEVPLEKLIEVLSPPRDTSRQPLFQVAFYYQNVPMIPQQFAGLQSEQVITHNGTSMFDLRFVLEDGKHGTVWGWLEYNTDLFDEAHMQAMVGHYFTLLAHACDAPETPIGNLRLLNEKEHQQIVYDWNNTSADYPATDHLLSAFTRKVDLQPTHMAVEASDRTCSYQQLEEESNQVAHWLHQNGVQHGDLVAVLLPRSSHAVVAILGILKCGAGYVPIDPSYPSDRIEYMLHDSGAVKLITNQELRQLLNTEQVDDRLLCLEDHSAAIHTQPHHRLAVAINPDDRAYVIYTSGSTGKPKGVVLRHRAAVNTIDWVNQQFAVFPTDRLMCVASFSFDLSVYDLFGGLGAGATLRICSEQEMKDPIQLAAILRSERISIWNSAPASLLQLVPFFPQKQVADLRLVLLSGDWIPVTLPGQITNAFPNAKVISLGGATEAAIWSNYYPIENVDPKWTSIPYGWPIRNAHYHVLDAHLQPTPVGVPGELHIGGVCLADGYHQREELTASRFIPDPFRAEGKLYKTGDQARYWPDGTIEFLGRIDHQVKVRGFRVELGEIEAALRSFPGVREAVVQAFRDADKTVTLAAFLQLSHEIVESNLQDFLRKALPEYMVPARFAYLEQFPVTSNGKLDRSALKLPELKITQASELEPPTDEIEQMIAEVFTDVLQLANVHRQANFFDVGGHSLKAAQLVGKLNQRSGIDIPFAVLFDHATVAGLANYVRQHSTQPQNTHLHQQHPELKDRGPASPIQEHFWLIDKGLTNRTIYNVVDVYTLRGPLDRQRFAEAWQAVVDATEMLRASFRINDNIVIQEYSSELIRPLRYVDATGNPRLYEETLTQLQHRTFALDQAGPWDAVLVHEGNNQHRFIWAGHHILVDEASRELLMEALQRTYASPTSAEKGQSFRYLDYSSNARSELEPARHREQIETWQTLIQERPGKTILPYQHTTVSRINDDGARYVREFPATLANQVALLARRHQVTPYHVYMAAFGATIAQLTRNDTVVIGTAMSQRHTHLLKQLFGCLVDMQGVIIPTAPCTVGELLTKTRQQVTREIQAATVPFQWLLNQIPGAPGVQDLFDAVFVLQENALSGQLSEQVHWSFDGSYAPGAKFDLMCGLEHHQNAWTLHVEYRTTLYPEDTAVLVAETFLERLQFFCDRETAFWNEPSESSPQKSIEKTAFRPLLPYQNVAELITACCEKYPTSVAFRDTAHSITFQQWELASHQLAGWLQSQQVRPNVPVVVCLERSCQIATAIFAVIKSGGGYVPLDPAHPEERLAEMIQQVAPPVILTSRTVADKLPTGYQVVCLEELLPTLMQQERTSLSNQATLDDLFAIIFTSGSTGKPKGVALKQRGVINLFCGGDHLPVIDASDVAFAASTYSFDIHILDYWWPATVGATTYIGSKDASINGALLIQELETAQATVMSVTPATWRILLLAGWQGRSQMKAISGGEPITADLAEMMIDRVAEFWNIYGPTETTVFSTSHHVVNRNEAPPVGKPVPNTQILIVDDELQPVAPGMTGEIIIAGDGVAQGYWNQPELTASVFLNLPQVSTGQGYRTGDIGFWNADGTLVCQGRKDHQVKIRGFRIELGEIETVMSSHPNIKMAVVVTNQDGAGLTRLVGYVQLHDATAWSSTELKTLLRSKLPDYMVPALLLPIEKFPLSPNGKVDRKYLRELPVEEPTNNNEYIPPENDAERALQPIWEEVFGIRPLSVTANFHDLGGHSLMAATLIARIESRLGHQVPLETLFAAPTIRTMSEAIRKTLELGSGAVVPLNANGKYPPLFMIAGAGGHVFTFHHFSRLMGEQFPVFGMKAIGIDGKEEPLSSIPAVAERYCQEILQHRPSGPIVLSGYSVGGRIAFETALQLRQKGIDVPAVIIYDAFAPGFPKRGSLTQRLYRHFKYFVFGSWQQKKAYLKKFIGKNTTPTGVEDQPGDLEGLFGERVKLVWERLVQANNAYYPAQQFDGEVIVIRSAVHPGWEFADISDRYFGWGQLTTGPLRALDVAGTHTEVFMEQNLPLLTQYHRETLRMIHNRNEKELEVSPVVPSPVDQVSVN
ncbi:MAG: amino acid adenylation domain-containing protein [Zavarzinella sp.]